MVQRTSLLLPREWCVIDLCPRGQVAGEDWYAVDISREEKKLQASK